jgi:hypothetical protein
MITRPQTLNLAAMMSGSWGELGEIFTSTESKKISSDWTSMV